MFRMKGACIVMKAGQCSLESMTNGRYVWLDLSAILGYGRIQTSVHVS